MQDSLKSGSETGNLQKKRRFGDILRHVSKMSSNRLFFWQFSVPDPNFRKSCTYSNHRARDFRGPAPSPRFCPWFQSILHLQQPSGARFPGARWPKGLIHYLQKWSKIKDFDGFSKMSSLATCTCTGTAPVIVRGVHVRSLPNKVPQRNRWMGVKKSISVFFCRDDFETF